MMRIENECVCCDIPCVNCGRRHTEVYYCDNCECEVGSDGFVYDGEELCCDCAKGKLVNKFLFNSERILDWVRNHATTEVLKELEVELSDYGELYEDYLQDESFEDLADDFQESYVRI